MSLETELRTVIDELIKQPSEEGRLHLDILLNDVSRLEVAESLQAEKRERWGQPAEYTRELLLATLTVSHNSSLFFNYNPPRDESFMFASAMLQDGWSRSSLAAHYKTVLEGTVTPEFEDGGRAAIAEITGDNGFFVRLQSWSPDRSHPSFDELTDNRVRVTIEPLITHR